LKRLVCLLVLACLAVTPATALAARETPSGISFAELEAFVDEYMEQYIGRSAPGAAVVLVKDGEIILSKGYGYADVENKLAVDPARTVFEYGSISKLFVYVTLMRLAEQGRLDLEADIRGYLPPGFLTKLKYETSITVLDIMHHTAGFEDYLFDIVYTSPRDLPPLRCLSAK